MLLSLKKTSASSSTASWGLARDGESSTFLKEVDSTTDSDALDTDEVTTDSNSLDTDEVDSTAHKESTDTDDVDSTAEADTESPEKEERGRLLRTSRLSIDFNFGGILPCPMLVLCQREQLIYYRIKLGASLKQLVTKTRHEN